MQDFDYVSYDVIDDGRIAAITLDRPKQRNAQNRGMLVQLGSAFDLAETDDTVRVVILRASGPRPSPRDTISGPPTTCVSAHPARTNTPPISAMAGRSAGWSRAIVRSGTTTSRTRSGGAISARSPVAEVHGMVLSAGLMLAWCCDLIVAGEDTVFADVVGTRLGMCGVEYFGHPWEFGPRKAKELLLTGDSIGRRRSPLARDGQQGLSATTS